MAIDIVNHDDAPALREIDAPNTATSRLANALVPRDFDTAWRMAQALAESGMFKGVTSPAVALAKMAAGADLGVSAFKALTSVHIINGSVMVSAGLLTELVDRAPGYDYRPVEATEERCEIAWFRRGVEVGRSEFTFAEATRAGLAQKDVWKKYPSDMLWARAFARGARRFAAGAIGPNVYIEDELEAIDVPAGPVQAARPPEQRSTGRVRTARELWIEARAELSEAERERIDFLATQAGGIGPLVGDREPGVDALRDVIVAHDADPPGEDIEDAEVVE